MVNLTLFLCTIVTPGWAAVRESDDRSAPIELVQNLVYSNRSEDKEFGQLDLYYPKIVQGYPVLVFAHGGGWKSGNKELFAFLGKTLAAHGIAVASINYRLFPNVKFPANLEDPAKAVAWVHRNIAKYGGQPERLFVGGHSAGGHLMSLLATDPTYLQAEGMKAEQIRGVISISGLYAIRRRQFPLFEDSDEAVRKASPSRQVKGRVPPFLLIYADNDFPGFGRMAEDFAKVLKDANNDVTLMRMKDRTHGSVATKIEEPADPARAAILDFIAKHK